MKRLTLDEVQDALPRLDELRPILDHLITRSHPDERSAWSRSGELGTLGARIVPTDSLEDDVVVVAAGEAERLRVIYAHIARALGALASNDRNAAARALLEAAAVEEGRDRPDRALAFAEAAYRAARDERDQRDAALAMRRWARACRAQSQLKQSADHYARAHEMALAMSDNRGAAEAAIGLGNVLEAQGRWQDAETWYRRSLEALRPTEGSSPERWHAFLNLHIVTRSRGAIEDSLRWLAQAEEVANLLDPVGAAPFLENARGQLAMARGSFDEAEAHFSTAIASAPSARVRVGVRLNLAETLLAQKRPLDAVEQAREAEREALRVSLAPKLPEVYRMLGRIASAQGNDDAFVFFERALDIIRERALPVLEEALTLQAYAACEASRGEEDAARQLHHRARELFETLGSTHMRQPWADVYAPPLGDSTHDGAGQGGPEL
jgi:tetratricopeptide (TPR) repeat protein